MNVFKPRGLCNALLLVTRSRILYGDVSCSRRGTVSSCPMFAGVEMSERAEGLAFLGGLHTNSTISKDLIGMIDVKVPLFRGESTDSRDSLALGSHIRSMAGFKVKSVSGEKKNHLRKYNII